MLRRLLTIGSFLMAGILVLVIGCVPTRDSSVQSVQNIGPGKTLYTFGDSNYDSQLKNGASPIKKGPIAASEIPAGFPQKFLEPDGSYAGGRVYSSIEDAQKAVLEAKDNGLISREGDWGIYELQGDWNEYTYEIRPNEHHLRKSTTAVRRVY